MLRLYPWLITIGFALAVASPARWHFIEHSGGVDSFPLSTYPMFSKPRPEHESFRYLVGIAPGGERQRIPSSKWSTGGWNQGRRQLDAILRSGPEPTMRLCAQVAEKLSRSNSPVGEVHILMGEYDLEQYFVTGNHEPLSEAIFAICFVKRAR
ncbi:MAG: hypothetical protein ACI8S6_001700 [Myxococcota bacterium]|jgi:hypothetical protein